MVKRRHSTKVKLFSNEGGVIDPNTGAYKSGSRTILYEDYANVQEVSLQERYQFEKSSAGTESLSADVKIYFQTDQIKNVEIDQSGEIIYQNGEIFRFHVTGINRTSRSVYCRYT